MVLKLIPKKISIDAFSENHAEKLCAVQPPFYVKNAVLVMLTIVSDLLQKLKTKVKESEGHVNSDELFSKVFKEWLEVRCSGTYLKTQKVLFNQALQQLKHHNAVNCKLLFYVRVSTFWKYNRKKFQQLFVFLQNTTSLDDILLG